MPAKDSLLHKDSTPHTTTLDTIPGQFYSTGHTVLAPQPRHENLQFWIPGVLFMAFLLIVLLRVFDARRLRQLFGAFLRMSSVSQFYREEYALTNRVSFFLLLNYLLCGALFIYQVLVYFTGGAASGGGIILFGLLAGGLALSYTVKVAAVRLLGGIFEVQDAAAEYTYNVLLFNKMLGLILFPVAVLLAFAVQLRPEWLVFLGLGFWSIALVYRILRGVLIGLSTGGVSVVNLFLYLCTLELLPFVVITKVFVSRF